MQDWRADWRTPWRVLVCVYVRRLKKWESDVHRWWWQRKTLSLVHNGASKNAADFFCFPVSSHPATNPPTIADNVTHNLLGFLPLVHWSTCQSSLETPHWPTQKWPILLIFQASLHPVRLTYYDYWSHIPPLRGSRWNSSVSRSSKSNSMPVSTQY